MIIYLIGITHGNGGFFSNLHSHQLLLPTNNEHKIIGQQLANFCFLIGFAVVQCIPLIFYATIRIQNTFAFRVVSRVLTTFSSTSSFPEGTPVPTPARLALLTKVSCATAIITKRYLNDFIFPPSEFVQLCCIAQFYQCVRIVLVLLRPLGTGINRVRRYEAVPIGNCQKLYESHRNRWWS